MMKMDRAVVFILSEWIHLKGNVFAALFNRGLLLKERIFLMAYFLFRVDLPREAWFTLKQTG